MEEKCGWCGSEMKVSKAGNEYCSNICWTKEPYKTEIKEYWEFIRDEAGYYDAENYGDR